MKTNKTLKWTQLMKAGTIAKDATKTCAALCKNADFIKQYNQTPIKVTTGTVSRISNKDWYAICEAHKFPYSLETLKTWKLQVSLPDYSMTPNEYKIVPGIYDEYGLPKIADKDSENPVLITKYAPTTQVIFTPWWTVESVERSYYTSKRYPYKEAVRLLEEAGATEVAGLFRDVYHIYKTVSTNCRRAWGWELKPGGAALLNLALEKYKYAQEALYRYNHSYITAVSDTKRKCVELEFEAKLRAEEGTHHADNFTLAEEDKIVVAAAVFEFGIVDADLINGVFDKYADTFRFKEYYTMRISGIADEPETLDDPHQWTTYHDVEDTDPMLTFLGKRIEKLFIGDTKAKLLQCYDWVMSLSEEDREPFYRTWVDDEGMTHTIKNLDDYAEMHWQLSQDKKHIEYRDYQIGLYADEGLDEEDIEYLFNELSDALPEDDVIQAVEDEDEDEDDFSNCIDEEDEDED